MASAVALDWKPKIVVFFGVVVKAMSVSKVAWFGCSFNIFLRKMDVNLWKTLDFVEKFYVGMRVIVVFVSFLVMVFVHRLYNSFHAPKLKHITVHCEFCTLTVFTANDLSVGELLVMHYIEHWFLLYKSQNETDWKCYFVGRLNTLSLVCIWAKHIIRKGG